MNWRVIARTDAALASAPRSTRLVLVLPAVTILAAAYLYPVFGSDPITTARFSGFVDGWLATVVPLTGVLLGHDAVVSERESGSLLLSLSLPHGRGDFVLGKVLSRVGLVSGVVLVAMVLGAGLVVYPFGRLEVVQFCGFVATTVAFGAIWTNLGIAASLSTATKQRAFVVAFGLFFLFVLVWDAIADGLQYGLDRAGLVDGSLPDPVQFVFGLEPGAVFQRVTAGFFDPSASVDGPWYLGEWVALAVFGLWLFGPLTVTYSRFAGSDLS
ncbi:ABC transporter permease [Natrinema thermotolerans]|uniref:ABC transporter permease n=1 Tax=Natrinema thermotolerans TaxID=121872 RepID=UPI0002B0BA1E|nr:ABC transporter permease subunit [Natrinema thermotolerans]ELZ16911.1 copper ABC transporter permease [Natrinema thermotolerans DSM 11552]QCC61793.1 ABC transporter permease [Natrinema thermotolerans]